MVNFIDKLVGFFSPQAGLQRALFRKEFESLSKTRDYEVLGDGFRNANKNYLRRASPTYVAASTSEELRSQSRHYTQNYTYAKRATNALAAKVVGKGIRPSFTLTDNRGTRSKIQEETLKRYWNTWADSNVCDFNGILDLYALQRQVMRTVIESGECLILHHIDKNNELQIRIIEPDMIDGNRNSATPGMTKQEYDYCGLRFAANGKPLGVYVFLNNPTYTTSSDSQFVSFDKIHLAFYQERAGMFRGTPFGVSSFSELEELHQYQDAAVRKAKVAACFSLYIKRARPGSSIMSSMSHADDCPEERLEYIEPGMIQYLNPDEDVITADPPSTEGYAEFVRATLRSIGAGYGLNYESVTGDYSQTNFSSGRLSTHSETDTIEMLQSFVMKPLMAKIGKWWAEVMLLRSVYRGNLLIEWTMPSKPITDPQREIKSLVDRLKNGLISPQEALRELGYDPDDVITETSEFIKKCDELGLKFEFDLRTALNPDSDSNLSDEEAEEDENL